ncbi:MAG: hypothetical protein AABZ36_00545 [Nitrospirota bacterium]
MRLELSLIHHLFVEIVVGRLKMAVLEARAKKNVPYAVRYHFRIIDI